MGIGETTSEPVRLSARNIGGISKAEVEFSPGITVLEGRNATNRTSLLQAIMAAMGSDDVSLKGDATEGTVQLSMGDETYTRTLERRDDTIVTSGNPYLNDPELGDLFAFLIESNEARQAVVRKDDLRDLLMRPVDTDSIETEIERLEAEKRETDEELERLEQRKRDLPDLERRRTELEESIEDKQAELDAKEEEIERLDADVEEKREERAELEERLDELRDIRGELDDVRFEIESERNSLNALRDRYDDLEADLKAAESEADENVAEVDAEIDRLRTELQRIDPIISELQTVIQFNEGMLEGTTSEVANVLRSATGHGDSGPVTDQLLEEEEVVCWTCGTEVAQEQIESTLSHLKELRREKREKHKDLKAELDELQQERRRYEEEEKQRQQARRELEQVQSEIEQREERVESLESRRKDLKEEVTDLESAVDELETTQHANILDRHKEANELEFELGRLQNELEDVTAEIDDIDDELSRQEGLEAHREGITDELTDLRTRIDRIEQSAVEQFNEHMDTILDLLDYANLDRIWIERTQRSVREGRRKVDKTVFELYVIRTTDSGSTYEDTVDHLSESEREVTGLIFALAGYLAHEVYEMVPFMLLDSLEAIDSERIAALVEYFADHADYLVVALLPEDAGASDTAHSHITDI